MVYTFQCPVCRKRIRFGYSCEPCCTGPSESRDEHEMTLMLLVKAGEVEIDPVASMARAALPLILPDDYRP